jgi:hypothetical protein
MRHRVTVAALALLLLVGVPPTDPAAAQQQAPEITLDPSVAIPGAIVTVDGSGFQPGQPLVILFGSLQSQPQATGSTDSLGRLRVQFPVPQVAPGSHEVFACTNYNPSASIPCRQMASANLTVPAPATTTTTAPQPTTTSNPLITETTAPQPTTTSSLSLAAITTTTVPPGSGGQFGAAFTTTSTSLQIPPALQDAGDPSFHPDLEIRGVEVTQVIQDMANRMPLVAGKTTMVRVYVGIDQPPPGDIGSVIGGSPPSTVGAEGWNPVDGVIHLQRGSETEILYADNGPITAYVEGGDRSRRDDSLNFALPPEWTHGQVTITAFVWSEHPHTALYAEADVGNNFAEGTVVFRQSEAPLVVIWRLDPGNTNLLTPSGFLSAVDQFSESYRRHLPVDVPNFFPIMEPLGPGSMVGDEEPSETWNFVNNSAEPLWRMRWMYLLFGYSGMERMHGAINVNTPSGNVSGKAHSSMTVAWSKPTVTTPAHEQAHMYGIKHVPCADYDGDGIPDEVGGGGWAWIDLTHPTGFPNCSLAPPGPDGYYGAVLDAPLPFFITNDPSEQFTRLPFMGYGWNTHADPFHYCLLMPKYGIPCNPTSIGVPPKPVPQPPVDCGPSPGPGIQLDLCLWTNPDDPLWYSGTLGGLALVAPVGVFESWVLVEVDTQAGLLGHAHLGPRTSLNESDFAFLVERSKQGMLGDEMMVRVTDGDGHILVQVPVTSAHAGSDAHDDSPEGKVVIVVPWPEDAASLDLLIADEVSDSRQPSAPPMVTLDPVNPSPGRQFSLSWSGIDPDGDDLLYTVQWSADDGNTWRALDTGFPQTSAKVDADSLALPGGEVHIRVTASDGFSTGSDQIGPLDIPTGLPTGFITGPDTVPQHSPQELTFHIYDPEDGPLSTGSWGSDIDGPRGEGRLITTRGLSVGAHEISVTVRDSDGNEVTITRALTVEESDLPEPRRPGAVPEAELLVALGPANLDRYLVEGLSSNQVGDDPAPGTPAASGRWAIWGVVALSGLATLGLFWRRRSTG